LQTGMLAGLAHPHLHRALLAIHSNPAHSWSLMELASLSGMSRSKFAEEFKTVLGQPPGDYLIEWRLGVAQSLLQKLKPVGLVAHEVGYENASVLARVFRKKLGLTPLEWLERQRELG
ncbi:MAG TPA: AraC family transcriptional regulator, partial [Cellvibrionaceae bacterium]|nr:AraC family transcriptional regulator [Cellvibrionaceae bacterium]